MERDWLWVGKRIAALTLLVLGAPMAVGLLLAYYGIPIPEFLWWLIPPGF